MITIEEVKPNETDKFWDEHIKYLVQDGIIDDEDYEYFTSNAYRGVIENHLCREVDRHHLIYFVENGCRIGASSYCIYHEEGDKCFILDFWVFPEFRGNGAGHRCFAALQEYVLNQGAAYYELNSEKADSIRFWKSLGFRENGVDEYGDRLFVKR